MTDPPQTPVKRRRWLKVLLWLVGIALLLATVAIAGLLLLPSVVSTEIFRAFAEKQASSVLARPVRLARLQWSWREGVRLEELSIADDPVFSDGLLLAVRRLAFKVELPALLRRRLVLDLELSGLEARFVRNAEGKTNLEALAAGIPKASAVQEPPKPTMQKDWRHLSFTLPVDVQSHLRLTGMRLEVEDRVQQRRLLVRDAALRLDVPSLRDQPVSLDASARLELDGREIPPSRVAFTVADLFRSDGTLDPAQASIQAKAAFPGGRFDVSGRLGEVRSSLEVSLAEVKAVVDPFLPPPVAATEVAGRVDLEVNASGDPSQKLTFATTLTGKALKVSGGMVGDRSLEVPQFEAAQRGVIDIDPLRVHIEQGEIHLFDRSRIFWQATADDFQAALPRIDLRVGPADLDLSELMAAIRDFVPQTVSLAAGPSAAPAMLKLEALRFGHRTSAGPDVLHLKDFSLVLPGISLNLPGTRIDLRALSLQVSEASAEMQDFFPVRVNLAAALTLDRADLQGPQPARGAGLAIPVFNLRVDDLQRSAAAPWGVTGRMGVQQSLALEAVDFPGLAGVDRLRESMEAQLRLTSDTPAELSIAKLEVSAPALRLRLPSLGLFQTEFSLESDLSSVKVHRVEPFNADLSGLRTRLRLGELLTAELSAEARNLAFDGLQTQGRVNLDLQRLVQQVPLPLPRGATLNGKFEIGWNLDAQRPGPGSIPTLAALVKDPKALLTQSARLKQLQLEAQIKGLAINWPLPGGQRFKAGRISTAKPMMVSVKEGARRIDASGEVTIGRLEHLPVLGKLKKPLTLTLSYSGAQEDLETLNFVQALAIEPLNLKQDFALRLTGIDRAIRRGLDRPWPLWLEALGGSVRAGLAAGRNADLSLLREDFLLDGTLNSGVEVDWTTGRELRARTWVESPGMNLRVGKWMEIENLQSRVNLAKDYRVVFGSAGKAGGAKSASPLSTEVLKSGPADRAGGSSFTRRLIDDLKTPFSGQHALSFTSARIQTQPIPLELTNQSLDFYLENGLPRMDHFQIDLLGGSIIGTCAVSRRDGSFHVTARGAFSGLNTKKLLPEIVHGVSDAEAEIGGQLSLAIPLAADQGDVLQAMELEVELTHIGARSLERLLYALDPYESNEVIVGQRQKLRTGTPRWIKMGIKDGMLTLRGQIEAKGIRLDLPPIERLNLVNLPAMRQVEAILAQIKPLVDLLRAASADTLLIDPEGGYHLMYSKEKGAANASR